MSGSAVKRFASCPHGRDAAGCLETWPMPPADSALAALAGPSRALCEISINQPTLDEPVDARGGFSKLFDRFHSALFSRRGVTVAVALGLAGISSGAEIANAGGSASLVKTALGVLGSLSYFAITAGLVDQIRKIHQHGEVPKSLSVGKLMGNGFRYLTWTLWASVQNPLQYFFLGTRVPGAILSGVLLSQLRSPKQSAWSYAGVTAAASGVIIGACAAINQIASPLLERALETTASASLLLVAVFGATDQIKRLRTNGTAGVSRLLQSAFALNYSFWAGFTALDNKMIAAAGFCVAATMSWGCVAQFSPRINPAANIKK